MAGCGDASAAASWALSRSRWLTSSASWNMRKRPELARTAAFLASPQPSGASASVRQTLHLQPGRSATMESAHARNLAALPSVLASSHSTASTCTPGGTTWSEIEPNVSSSHFSALCTGTMMLTVTSPPRAVLGCASRAAAASASHADSSPCPSRRAQSAGKLPSLSGRSRQRSRRTSAAAGSAVTSQRHSAACPRCAALCSGVWPLQFCAVTLSPRASRYATT
mmetsp:Transcript_9996/g.25510  ORF Transcript_9996/g.25510 Transcript_9996/m.25510 type:complete len:224 (-) Transcript_9996:832-1503(-)